MSGVISAFENTVTLRKVTETFNMYGDSEKTFEDSTIKAGVNDITGDEEWNKMGAFVPGDKIFFIKADTVGLEDNSILVFMGENYRIFSISKHYAQDTLQHYEVKCKRF